MSANTIAAPAALRRVGQWAGITIVVAAVGFAALVVSTARSLPVHPERGRAITAVTLSWEWAWHLGVPGTGYDTEAAYRLLGHDPELTTAWGERGARWLLDNAPSASDQSAGAAAFALHQPQVLLDRLATDGLAWQEQTIVRTALVDHADVTLPAVAELVALHGSAERQKEVVAVELATDGITPMRAARLLETAGERAPVVADLAGGTRPGVALLVAAHHRDVGAARAVVDAAEQGDWGNDLRSLVSAAAALESVRGSAIVAAAVDTAGGQVTERQTDALAERIAARSPEDAASDLYAVDSLTGSVWAARLTVAVAEGYWRADDAEAAHEFALRSIAIADTTRGWNMLGVTSDHEDRIAAFAIALAVSVENPNLVVVGNLRCSLAGTVSDWAIRASEQIDTWLQERGMERSC